MAKHKAENDELPAGVPEASSSRNTGESKPPEFGTATEADPKADLPRVINELERAPKGTTRYKVRSDSYGGSPSRYILAKAGDKAGAEALYRKLNSLDKKYETAKASGSPNVAPAVVHLVELPD